MFSAKAGIDANELLDDAPTPEMTENPVAIIDVRETGVLRRLRGLTGAYAQRRILLER